MTEPLQDVPEQAIESLPAQAEPEPEPD